MITRNDIVEIAALGLYQLLPVNNRSDANPNDEQHRQARVVVDTITPLLYKNIMDELIREQPPPIRENRDAPKETDDLKHKNVCVICFCLVADFSMQTHLDWHRIAATPELHKVVLEKALKG
jgi:hypothetical protein